MTAEGLLAVAFGVLLVVLLHRSLDPVIREAAESPLLQGGISGGVLQDGPKDSVQLAENLFLSLHIDPLNVDRGARSADCKVAFHDDRLSIESMFGRFVIPYPLNWEFDLNSESLGPAWKAWKGMGYLSIIVATSVFVVLSWVAASLGLMIPGRLIAFYLKRSTSITDLLKLAKSALVPGFAMLTLGLLGYALRILSLTTLTAVWVIHLFVAVGVFLFLLSRWPKQTVKAATTKKNPFEAN